MSGVLQTRGEGQVAWGSSRVWGKRAAHLPLG